MNEINQTEHARTPWNKRKLVGQKPPLKLKEIWAIRIRLEIANKIRDLALFNLAIDSKLRGCDLVKIRVLDVSHGGNVTSRAKVMQQKTHQPVQFEISEQSVEPVAELIKTQRLKDSDYLFKSRFKDSEHLSTRQYARIVEQWVATIGLDPAAYATHSMRRSKAALIYRAPRT